MPLHPQVEALLKQLEAAPEPAPSSLPPVEARPLARANALRYAAPPEPVAAVRRLEIDGPGGSIPARLYRPAGEGPFPVLLFFHGGGFLFGGLDEVDDAVRHLAARTPCVALSVDYRLAPENPFPAAPEDAYAALAWAASHAAELGGDPARIAVAGDSAGGNLAAVVCLMARDRGGPRPSAQLLIYPVVDFAHPERYPSTDANAEGYLLTRDEMAIFRDHYLPAAGSALEPYASPMLAPSLEDLPPAWVLTAGYDPLRDQGERYAERLERSGVEVELRRYDDMVHAFFTMAGVFDRGLEARDEAVRYLRAAFGQGAATADGGEGDAP